MSCIKSILKRGKTTLPGNDANLQTVQVQYLNKVTVADIVNPCGFAHNPLAGQLVILLNMQGVEDNMACIVTDQLTRTQKLSPGETILYNTMTQSFIYLKNDGSIELSAPLVTINAAVTNVNGTLNINGSLNAVDGAVITGDLSVSGQTSLGAGGAAIARVGDSVLVGASTGTITSGSSNNTAN
jgi:phage gp45-like